MGLNVPPPIVAQRHHEIIAARRAAEARGGTKGYYLVSDDFIEPDPVLACLAAITPNAAAGLPLHDGPAGVEVTRWACPGCGRLGWLARHPNDPPCEGLCPRCQPQQDPTQPAPPDAPDNPSPARTGPVGKRPALRAAAPTRAHLTAAAERARPRR